MDITKEMVVPLFDGTLNTRNKYEYLFGYLEQHGVPVNLLAKSRPLLYQNIKTLLPEVAQHISPADLRQPLTRLYGAGKKTTAIPPASIPPEGIAGIILSAGRGKEKTPESDLGF